MTDEENPERGLATFVTGLPASGKSTVIDNLGPTLSSRRVFLSRDGIQDLIRAQIGEVGDVAQSRAIGASSWEVLFHMIDALAHAHVPMVIDCNLSRTRHRNRLDEILRDYRISEVHCTAPGPVLLDRYRSRALSGDRASGTFDLQRIEEFGRIFSDPVAAEDARIWPEADFVEIDTSVSREEVQKACHKLAEGSRNQ